MPPQSKNAPQAARAQSVTVSIPGPLRKYCRGAGEIEVTASSVRAVLDDLERQFPEIYRSTCDETGSVRRHMNLFVNSDHIRDRDGLETALDSGDVVTIMTAVSGG